MIKSQEKNSHKNYSQEMALNVGLGERAKSWTKNKRWFDIMFRPIMENMSQEFAYEVTHGL